MNSQGIISINPINNPEAIQISKNFLNHKAISAKPISAMKKIISVLLGVNSSVHDSRRQWSFRVILGSIFMIFGVIFLQTKFFVAEGFVEPAIAVAMIVCGVLIACGLLTRIVSFGLGLLLIMGVCHHGMASMTGYSMLVCMVASIAGVVIGSGRFSLDTMIYNMIIKRMYVGV